MNHRWTESKYRESYLSMMLKDVLPVWRGWSKSVGGGRIYRRPTGRRKDWHIKVMNARLETEVWLWAVYTRWGAGHHHPRPPFHFAGVSTAPRLCSSPLHPIDRTSLFFFTYTGTRGLGFFFQSSIPLVQMGQDAELCYVKQIWRPGVIIWTKRTATNPNGVRELGLGAVLLF
jgi:hypothetical protein